MGELKIGQRYIVINGKAIPIEQLSKEEQEKIFLELNDRALRASGRDSVK